MPPSPSAAGPASPEVIEIERALTQITYPSTRARQHERLMALAGVPLDRAAVALPRQVADSEPLRPGELAGRLDVEASHATRQVQRLERSGHADQRTLLTDPRVSNDDHEPDFPIDAFEALATPGTALVCVSDMAGHVASLNREDESALATAPAEELLGIGAVEAVGDDETGAYIVSKRANQVRVEAAALAWSRRGARINSLSPGVIATAMSKAEAEGPSGAHMLAMLEASGAGRTGTPAEIADAVAFLVGPAARCITGTGLLVDGGQAAWLRRHRPA